MKRESEIVLYLAGHLSKIQVDRDKDQVSCVTQLPNASLYLSALLSIARPSQ